MRRQRKLLCVSSIGWSCSRAVSLSWVERRTYSGFDSVLHAMSFTGSSGRARSWQWASVFSYCPRGWG